MSPEAILAIIQGLSVALPTLIGLFQKARAGGVVTPADIAAAVNEYDTARQTLLADIASQQAAAQPKTT